MSTVLARKRIGRWNDVASRQIVYQTGEALEVDEIDHFEIIRKRVYFDDVLLVTMHSQVGVGFVITMGIFFVLLLSIAAVFQSANVPYAAAGFAVTSLPFLVAVLARLILRQEVITVYGRRSKAAMKFTFRKTFAHEKFNEICSLVNQSQERVAAEARAMEPPPQQPSEIPMPPAEELAAPIPATGIPSEAPESEPPSPEEQPTSN
jgi:hypothetical protein